MLKIYIIGSDRFNGLKEKLFNSLNESEGVNVLAVGFSPLYNFVINKKDYEALHDLEDKSIREADLLIVVDNDGISDESYIGKDTLRELKYSIELNKTIWTSDMLFRNYLKIKGQQWPFSFIF